jgi:NitT/TauT family transport system permease protein/putative hydroxymethylpyrimidine transport system permease protein
MGAALLVLVLLAGWELYADLGGIDQFLLPAPSDVATSLWTDRGLLWDNFTVTAGEVLLGIAVSLAAGVALAVAIHLSRTLRRATYPLLVASQTIPIVIVAPLLVAWLGYDLAPKLAIVGLICFFPVVVTTLDGLAGVDPDLRKLMRTLDASRLQTLRHVEAPAALPALLSGAKIAVTVAVIGAVLAEQAGSSDGLGHLILQSIPQFETARSWAAVVVLAAFAILLFGALALAERRLAPWAARSRNPGGPAS